ncbi:hypothetical protein D3C76_1277570 [compost metagenome]
MLTNQLQERLLLEAADSRLPGRPRLPLQILQDPTAIVAGLDAGCDQTIVLLGQVLAARHQRLGQRALPGWRDFELDHLGKTQAVV